MSALLNLLVDLDEWTPERAAEARRSILAHDFTLDALEPGTDDRALAWIDAEFGGLWSAEAFAGTTFVARSRGQTAGFVTIGSAIAYRWLDGAGREPQTGIFGPFGVAPEHRGGVLGPALLALALSELRARGYTRALIPAVHEGRLSAYYERISHARVVERFTLEEATAPRPRVVVMASGSGTNFQAVADAVASGALPIDLVALVCNRPGAYCLERAARLGIRSHVVQWARSQETRAQYDERLLQVVRAERPDSILLLGWMHLLHADFVNAFPALINVHPAFLPHDPSADTVAFPDGTVLPVLRGAHAIADALQSAAPWTGVSVHLVTAETDRGEVLMRRPFRVDQMEEEALAQDVHRIEHDLVPRAIRGWLFRA